MLAEKIQLEADEAILAQVRKHWFVLTFQLVGVAIAGFIPLVLITLLYFTPLNVFLSSPNATPIISVLYAGWLIFTWMALFGVWTNYYLDVWTVTTKRLVTVDQRGLFFRDTGSFRLERLQDINVSIRGILATFLNFGDLQAETASNDTDFVARGIPDPQGLKSLILEAADKITFTRPINAGNGEGS
jgi:hypothetical protein